MRHFTQRLMMVVMATFMAVGSLWAATTIEFGVTYSNDGEYSYANTSGSSCDVTINGSCTVWTRIGYADYGSSVTAPYTLTIPAGQTGFFWTSGASSGISFSKVGGSTGGGSVTPGPDPEDTPSGSTPEKALTLEVGSNACASTEGNAKWYKIEVPNGKQLGLTSEGVITYKGYVGIADANADANATSPDGYTRVIEYTNNTGAVVTYYLKVSCYSDINISASIADAEGGSPTLSGDGSQYSPYVIVSGMAMPCPSSYSTIYYQYTATEDCLLVLDDSQLPSYTAYFNYGSDTYSCNYSFNSKIAVSNGQIVYISCYSSSNISNKTVTFTARAAEVGESAANPIVLTAGSYTWGSISFDTWYKITVPSKHTLKISDYPTYNTKGYIGLSAATSGTSVSPTNYDNTSASAVDFYICIDYNYSPMNTTITLEEIVDVDFSHVRGSGTSSSPYNIIVDKMYPGGTASSTACTYYQYTATSECWITIDDSHIVGDRSIYASTTLGELTTQSSRSNHSFRSGVMLNAGQTLYVAISFRSNNSRTTGKYVIFHAGEVPAGAAPAKAHELAEGVNSIATLNEWYSIAVPAGATLTFVPQAYMSYQAFAGLDAANAKNPSLSTSYVNGIVVLTYTNETSAGLNVYIYPTYTETSSVSVTLESNPAPENNITSFGDLVWNVVDGKINEGSYATVTFPNHVGGEDEDEVEVDAYVYELYAVDGSVKGAPLNLGEDQYYGTLADGVDIEYDFEGGKAYRVSITVVKCGSLTTGLEALVNYSIDFEALAPAQAPTILSATNGGNAAGTTVNEVAQDFIVTLSEESAYANYGVYYQFSDDETAPVTDLSANVSISMNADKTQATIHVESAKLSLNGRHVIYITAGAFVNANDETKKLATPATFTWTRNAAETYPLNIYEDFASMYWNKNWTVESGVEVYYGVWNSEYSCIDLYLYTGSVVPANQGVMVRSVGAETTVLTATDEEPNGTMEGNQFKGTVAPAGVYRNTGMTTYVYTKSGVFARYTGEMIPAYRAYMELVSGVAPASARMRIVNTTTDIEGVDANVNVQKQMINGQLFIIRDGKMYNVQGVLVK